jgi:hypothetical protein
MTKKFPTNQIDKYREAARALDADEDERKFDASLRKVVQRGNQIKEASGPSPSKDKPPPKD